MVRFIIIFSTYLVPIKLHNIVKPSQNKKGQKKFQLHRFLNTFSQLPAAKKYSKNGAAGKDFGPSYFDPALGTQTILKQK